VVLLPVWWRFKTLEKIKAKKSKRIYTALIIIGIILFLTSATIIASKSDIIVIDRFSMNKDKDGVPAGWELKKKEGKADIRIERDGDGNNVFLHFISRSSSFGINKKVKFKTQDFPILNWSWKVDKLCEGGDVRKEDTDDQAAQVYIVFPRFPVITNTRLIGYIWDNEAPKGSMVTSKKWSKLKYIVLRNKTDELNKWFNEQRNVYDDYKRLFREEPPKVEAIALYINSQNKKSTAESYFDDIYFSKE